MQRLFLGKTGSLRRLLSTQKPTSAKPSTTTATANLNAEIVAATQELQGPTVIKSTRDLPATPSANQIEAYETDLLPEYSGMTSPQRQARIYKPAKSAMQSGTAKEMWMLDFDPLEKWENPMIGYVSSADSVQALRMKFHTREQAVGFAENQGWHYVVQDEPVEKSPFKSYSNNFKYSAGKLRFIQTK